jgi:electron transport complex protein RnfA
VFFQQLFGFFGTGLFAIFAQNLVFTGGYGMCELLRVAARPKRLFLFCGILTAFSTVSAAANYFISGLFGFSRMSYNFRILVFVLVMAALYVITVLVLRLFRPDSFKRLWKLISLAAFNSAVLVVPFFNYKSGSGFGDSVLLGLTSGIGFFFAAVLVQSGLKRLNNPDMPKAFRGLPAAFLYIGILSLVFLGIYGNKLYMVF